MIVFVNLINCTSKGAESKAKDSSKKSNLGLGVVKFECDENTVIKLYKDTQDKEPSKELIFYNDTSISCANIKDIESYESDWLKPEAIIIDYDILYFRADYASKQWLRLIVNNTTRQSMWVHKTSNLTLKSWEKLLKEDVSSVAPLNLTENPLRAKPNSTSNTVKFHGDTSFSVIKFKENWIQVSKYTDDEGDIAINAKPIGWILWRDSNDLLVDIYFGD